MAESFEMQALRKMSESLAVVIKILASWYQRAEQAVKTKFGADIKLRGDNGIYSSDLLRNTQAFVDDLEFKVLRSSDEPKPTQPCIIDQSINEFHNVGEVHKLESIVKAGKNTTIAVGTRYHFKIADGQGVSFEHKYDLGAQIVSINMTGGRMRVGDKYTILWDQKYNKDLRFRYDHKETVSIPPLTRVAATVTTSTKMLEQEYTLEFYIKRDRKFLVKYLTRFQQKCRCLVTCCCCCHDNLIHKGISMLKTY